jgi:t-SNARE complex subunit (syntaxin)
VEETIKLLRSGDVLTFCTFLVIIIIIIVIVIIIIIIIIVIRSADLLIISG